VRERENQRERETYRQTDREGERDRQIETYREIQIELAIVDRLGSHTYVTSLRLFQLQESKVQ